MPTTRAATAEETPSTRWEGWKETRTFVMSLDMSLVPVGDAERSIIDDPPGRVYVAATPGVAGKSP